MRKQTRVVGISIVVALVGVLGVPGAAAQPDPTVAPAAQLSADGRTATVPGGPSLSVSRVNGIADGQSITVSGAGFDENKGIYIALCAIPPANHAPSPCGGGQDRDGGAGVSTWISSNPPAYAEGIPDPYGPGGSFTTAFAVSPMISPTIDCRVVACAIVTRNDHTRSSDRSQDLFVPVTFAPPGTDPTVPPSTEPPVTTTTTSTTTTTMPAATTTIAPDGRSVSDDTRTLAVSTVSGLDPSGATIDVTGVGYSDATGVLVALCALPEDGSTPGPCTAGSAGASAWVSSSPPDYAVGLVEAYGDGGTFAVTLTVPAVIDADTDCRRVACAVTTRADDTNPGDRSQELALPVQFEDEAAQQTTTSTADEPEMDDTVDDVAAAENTSSGTPWLQVVVAVLALAVAAGTVVWRRRARRAGATAVSSDGPAE